MAATRDKKSLAVRATLNYLTPFLVSNLKLLANGLPGEPDHRPGRAPVKEVAPPKGGIDTSNRNGRCRRGRSPAEEPRGEDQQ